MSTKINPVGSKLFILVTETGEKTASGLFIPVEARNNHYIVQFAGPDATVAPGTRVLVQANKCGKTTVDGTTYLVSEQADLLATLEDDA